MLKKVQQAAAKQAARLEAQATRNQRTAKDDALANRLCMAGNTKLGIEEAKRSKLGTLAHSKPSENNGQNYAVDARKERKQMKPACAKYDKPSDFGTRTATAGSKTDATINSYFRNKRGDNLPRTRK